MGRRESAEGVLVTPESNPDAKGVRHQGEKEVRGEQERHL